MMPIPTKRRKIESEMDSVIERSVARGGGPVETVPSQRDNEETKIPVNKPKLLWEIKNKEGYCPRLYHPYDVSFLWDNRVVVVEGFWPYSRIQLLDLQGKSIMSLAQGDILPFGITVDNEGYMAVTDHKDRTVKFYTPDGNTALSWKPHMFDWPDGIATTSDSKYLVADWSKGQVSTHDIDGVTLRSFSTVTESEERSNPCHLTVDRHHRVLVTDTFTRNVKVFDQSGQLLFTFGGESGSNGNGSVGAVTGPLNGANRTITDPRGICTDSSNNILIADWGTNCISKFSSDGQFIETVLGPEDGENRVMHPWGLATTDSGMLLVSEQKLDKKDPRMKLFQSVA